jgi:hypothetical protein
MTPMTPFFLLSPLACAHVCTRAYAYVLGLKYENGVIGVTGVTSRATKVATICRFRPASLSSPNWSITAVSISPACTRPIGHAPAPPFRTDWLT